MSGSETTIRFEWLGGEASLMSPPEQLAPSQKDDNALAERKKRLTNQLRAKTDEKARRKREYNRDWSSKKYKADPHTYNRARLIRQLNDRRIVAPREATIVKYNLVWNASTDTWA